MRRQDYVNRLLSGHNSARPGKKIEVFAPTNIALCKYWGKRDALLNLPLNSSLSLTLPQHGTWTSLQVIDAPQHEIFYQGARLSSETAFALRLKEFLALFTADTFRVHTRSNIPLAAGLASSASGFAALTLALQQLYRWNLSLEQLSGLARLGSGSASRSFWPGFVVWDKGSDEEGADCHGRPLDTVWPELRLGLLVLETRAKAHPSREAMQHTLETSKFMQAWPERVHADIEHCLQAMQQQDFEALGRTMEANAQCLHALMMTAEPPICYSTPQTYEAMQQVQRLRARGVPVYFTQDAGPNLKLLFQRRHQDRIEENFPQIESVIPFPTNES